MNDDPVSIDRFTFSGNPPIYRGAIAGDVNEFKAAILIDGSDARYLQLAPEFAGPWKTATNESIDD